MEAPSQRQHRRTGSKEAVMHTIGAQRVRNTPIGSIRDPRGVRVIQKLLDAYSINIEHTSERHLLNGPDRTAGLEISTRTVYCCYGATFERVFHEIAHIVTAPPDIDYETVPEDFLLLQLERCWCRHLKVGDKLLRAVLKWQGGTAVPLISEEENAMLDEVADYERSYAWRQGFRRLRKIGLIDNSNRPTLRSATWTEDVIKDLRRSLGEKRTET